MISNEQLINRSYVMKSKYSPIVLIPLSFLVISCASIKQTIYLQDVEVKGPMNPPPVRITKDKSAGTFTLSPRLSVNKYSEISGNIGSRKYLSASQDSVFRSSSKNLFWKIPQVTFGCDFDFAVSNNFAIAGGLNHSIIDQKKLIGGSLGIAFYQEKNGNAVRFDAGILVQELYYDAKTVVETTTNPVWGYPYTTVSYYHDRDKNADIDLYVMLTYNSVMKEFPLNFFLNMSYFTQTILDFNPRTTTDLSYLLVLSEKTIEDVRGEASSAYLSATPGIFIDFTEWSRIVLGARLMYDIGLDTSSRDFFILPVVQLDMHF